MTLIPLFLRHSCSWLVESPRCLHYALSTPRSYRLFSSSTQRRLTCSSHPFIKSSSTLMPEASCLNDRAHSNLQQWMEKQQVFPSASDGPRMNTCQQYPPYFAATKNFRNVLHFKKMSTQFHRYSHKNVYMRQRQKAPSSLTRNVQTLGQFKMSLIWVSLFVCLTHIFVFIKYCYIEIWAGDAF